MSRRVTQLTGAELDYWVGRAEGWTFGPPHKTLECDVWRDGAGEIRGTIPAQAFQPSSDWSQGGPIIEREMMELSHDRDWREDGEFGRVWQANHAGYGYVDGDTPLIAAMRAFVAYKFGAEVDAAPHPNTKENT